VRLSPVWPTVLSVQKVAAASNRYFKRVIQIEGEFEVAWQRPSRVGMGVPHRGRANRKVVWDMLDFSGKLVYQMPQCNRANGFRVQIIAGD
jgi:hypothetical protein